MDTYTSQAELARRQRMMEAMQGRNTTGQGIGGGLANMLRGYRGGKENRAIEDAMRANESLRSSETQAITQALKNNAGGNLQGPPTRMGQAPSLQVQTPELQEFQLKQAMGQQTADQAHQRALEIANTRGANNERWGAVQYRMEDGKPVPYQTSNFGGHRDLDVENAVMPGSMQAYDPNSIATKGAADTQVNVNDITATAQPEANAAGLRVESEEAARTGALVDRQTRLANAEHQQQLELDINRRTAELESSEQKQELVNGWIDGAIDEADAFSTGFFGTALEYIPGTDAFDLVATVDSIKANVGFDKLQAMRDASPTGGALGQVSEFENRLLQATLGNLDNSQSKEQFVKNLNELRYQLDQIVNRGISSFDRDYNQGQSITDRADAILRGL